MKLFHQTGHNCNWNIDSYKEDNVGDGLIYSPINKRLSSIRKEPKSLKRVSFLDPQFFLPMELKSKMKHSHFFPATYLEENKISNIDDALIDIAESCINYQLVNEFKYLTIPSVYIQNLESNHYKTKEKYFINSFIDVLKKKKSIPPILYTLIIKEEMVLNKEMKEDLLNWATSLRNVHGFYVIFDNNFKDREISNPKYLLSALNILKILKLNDFKVVIGYTSTEGLIYSLTDPDIITMGSYNNLKNFSIDRFQNSDGRGYPPKPRLYSGSLFRFVDYETVETIKELYPEWDEVFENSKYNVEIFKPTFQWHFSKPELYKHYFKVYYNQVSNLPKSIDDRIEYLGQEFTKSINLYDKIDKSGIMLEEPSHLRKWLTVLNFYKKTL